MTSEDQSNDDSRINEQVESDSLESKLTIGQLVDLRSRFVKRDMATSSSADVNTVHQGLNRERFMTAMRDILKTDDQDEKASDVFRKITDSRDDDDDRPTISWDSLLDHLIKQLRNCHESKLIRTFPSLDLDHSYLLLTHNRRESTVKVITITASTLIYVFISKLGVVGILDQHLKLQNTYSVDLDDFRTKEPSSKNRKFVLDFDWTIGTKRMSQAWVTDAVYMGDCKKLVVASTKRTLHFFDISAATHMEEYRLFGLANSATCFAYWFNENEEDKGSLLFYGDDGGQIHRLHFRRPETLLFKKKDIAEGLVRVFFMSLEEHNEYVVHSKMDVEHGDGAIVTRIQYVAENQSLISCSDGESSPLLITDVNGKLERYVFRGPKGIKCFDFNRPLNFLVTGSRDCLVRFWNPYVTSAPSASLKGHLMTVLDTRISYDTCVVISYSIDMVIMIWDIAEQLCLQMLNLHFPVAAKLPSAGLDWEHGLWPLHLDTFKSTCVLVTCKDYVTDLRLIKTKTSKWKIVSAMTSSEITKSKKGRVTHVVSKEERKQKISTTKSFANDQYQIARHMKMASENLQFTTFETETSIPALPSYTRLKQTNEALEEFGNYIFFKLRQFDGHLTRKEIESLAKRGMPMRALKVEDPTPIVSRLEDLPVSEQKKGRRPSYRHDTSAIPATDISAKKLHLANVLLIPTRHENN